jgi:predicted transcriptional regulator
VPMKLDFDRLLAVGDALGNPHRLRILAALSKDRNYVSELARQLELSRPLLYLHLEKLEAAGLVTGALELSQDGKAMKYYELTDFDLRLTPAAIAAAVKAGSSKGGA